MLADMGAKPPQPRTAATSATTRNISAHLSILKPSCPRVSGVENASGQDNHTPFV